ncbi:MAG TPA: ABC transporter permease [Planctomycetota bacterium]|nr:ABC transporter permease [Planctomycetota bacterium]
MTDPIAIAERGLARRTALRRLWSALGPFLVLIGVCAVLALVVGEPFLAPNNLRNILVQTVIVAAGALGMTMIIVAGGIDLSSGSAIALTSVCAALALKDEHGPIAAIAAAIAAGATVGAVNGAAIAWLRLPPFIVTLGMLGVARGLAKALADEQAVNFAPTWLDLLMRPIPRAADPAWIKALAVAPGVWLIAVLAAAMILLMRRSVFGRHLYAIGSNEAAARLCGIRIERTKLELYALAGAFFGCAGLLMTARLRQGDPTTAMGLELDIIAAVVIGGASLAGGVGSITGSLIGALIMAVLRNGSQQLGWPNYMQEIIIGAVIVVAVALDRLRQGRSRG